MRTPPLHQGEPADAALLDALIHEVTDIVPLSPWAMAALTGVLLVTVPVLLIVLVSRRLRKEAYHSEEVADG